MYCPGCATQNVDSVKFCRACGTNLEVVSLALRGQSVLPAEAQPREVDWIEKQRTSKRRLIQGGMLLGLSALIAAFGFSIIGEPFVWLMIWAVFFGWMAGWGGVLLSWGLSSLIEAKSALRELSAVPVATAIADAHNTNRLTGQSVTEDSTRKLSSGS